MPTHVDISKEFQHCRSMGQNLRKKLSLFCVKNNIKFLGTQGPFNLEEAIQSEQNTTPIILLQIHDALAGSKSYWKSINQQLSLIGKKLLVCTDSFVDMANFSNITFLTHPALLD